MPADVPAAGAGAVAGGAREEPCPVGVGRAFGTFGELLQGGLWEPDLDFLVTLPIARWATATFALDPAATDLRVRPEGKRKSLAVARLMLDQVGVTGGGTLTIGSEIPEGKGLASSSADLVATAHAVGGALGIRPTAPTVESLLRTVEPSDGVMYGGVVAFYHRQVRLRAHLGYLPAMTIVGVDEGGQVDSLAFNEIPKPFGAAHKREYQRLLDVLTTAVRSGDLATVGRVATRSALMNQELRPKETLQDVLGICEDVGALGVVAAHSGTVLGLLLADDDPDYADKLRRAEERCTALGRTCRVDHSLQFAMGAPVGAPRTGWG